MTAAAWSVAMVGLEGRMIDVQAAVGGGLPRTVIIGLADTALREAKDRCKPAVQASGLSWPTQLVTVNLSPGNLPKMGTHYDLSIVAAVLAAQGAVETSLLPDTVLLGEVNLRGQVLPVPGILPAVLTASEAGILRAIVPADQVAEARLVAGVTVWGISSVTDLVDVLAGRPVSEPAPPVAAEPSAQPRRSLDMADLVGQHSARWALEVAAAGRHHIFLHGPPGVGKTMLAERLPSILPPLTPAEAIEVSAIHSLAGVLEQGLITTAPYADPLQNASIASLVGGGPRVARPGSISLAHRGVLFLDEAPEFGPKLIEALRTPLESGSVTIGRAEVQARFPARFQLVLAANPCPCGNAGTVGANCTCAPMRVRSYLDRISGPIMDRIDIQQRLEPLTKAALGSNAEPGEASAAIRDRVAEARERQHHRLRATGYTTNGEVPGSILRHDLPRPDGVEVIDQALIRGQLSARGVDKILRLAWTIADLDGKPRVAKHHVRTAMAMRQGEQVMAA